MRSVLGFFLPGVVCVLVFGCSSTFDREWDQYVPGDTEDPIVGRWEGAWRSARTGRQGRLRCILSRQARGRYQARCQSTGRRWWGRELEYTVIMKTDPGEGERILKGSRNFGWGAGGIVHYRGEVEGDVFNCLYSGEEDRGAFELTRYAGDTPSPP